MSILTNKLNHFRKMSTLIFRYFMGFSIKRSINTKPIDRIVLLSLAWGHLNIGIIIPGIKFLWFFNIAPLSYFSSIPIKFKFKFILFSMSNSAIDS